MTSGQFESTYDGQTRGTGQEMGDRREDTGDLQSRASTIAEEAKGQVDELAPRAREAAYNAAESGREGAANVLERAAERVEDRGSGNGGMQATAAARAAEGMHAAAGYLKEHETAEIVDEVEQYVRAHPMRSLATAVAAGFVVGRILR